ncbi:MAG: galactofuranose ABC transporter, permease protein YjfF [Fimbriimonas sp.]
MRERLPIIATAAVCILLYVIAGLRFEGFFSLRVFFNFLSDNAFLGVIAVGLTFVILSGGIDLSVGAMVGCAGIMGASLITKSHLHPAAAFGIVLAFGCGLGLMHGALIQFYKLPPFLVTLGGLFFCRGVALWISKESMQIDHSLFNSLSQFSISLPGRSSLPLTSIIWLLLLGFGAYLAKQTRFGRTTYAIGGNEVSAVLMGLPVKRTKVLIYTLSGFCSALGGLVFAFYTGSGNAISGAGLELDAIAAVVIGGTLLSGGYGSVLGSFLGVLILGIIQTAITFEGTLSSWWTKIAVGTLLLIFILLQKLIERTASSRSP